MASFTIREATPDDLPAIVAMINTDHPEPYTLEGFTVLIQRLQKQPGYFGQWVLEDDNGRLAGALRLHHHPYTKGEMVTLPVVAPDARNCGYGSALLALALDTARAQGAKGIESFLPDTHLDARLWAERRGFSLSAHRFESVLDLTTFDETVHADVQERLTGDGISFQDMGTLSHDEANWTRLYTFFVERGREAPDFAGMPPMTVEQARYALREDPTVQPEDIVLATQGEDWLGMSALMRHPRGAYNLFTGVSPEARGLGLARALKVEVIRRARAAGFTQMVTQNHSANVPMLAVNQHLGFERRSGFWFVRQPLS